MSTAGPWRSFLKSLTKFLFSQLLFLRKGDLQIFDASARNICRLQVNMHDVFTDVLTNNRWDFSPERVQIGTACSKWIHRVRPKKTTHKERRFRGFFFIILKISLTYVVFELKIFLEIIFLCPVFSIFWFNILLNVS